MTKYKSAKAELVVGHVVTLCFENETIQHYLFGCTMEESVLGAAKLVVDKFLAIIICLCANV